MMGNIATFGLAFQNTPMFIPGIYSSYPTAVLSRANRRFTVDPLRTKLSVCTDEDCVQQGAYQTLRRLKEVVEGRDIEVKSSRCLGMCGLGPCVSIEWDDSRMESRGGIEADDNFAIKKLVEEATAANPAPASQLSKEERDPYEEQ